MPQLLVQNALDTIKLNGLLAQDGPGSDHSHTVIELRRVSVPDDLVRPKIFKFTEDEPAAPYFRADLAPRQPSRLPAPGRQVLEATLGPRLGYGRSSVVHALDQVTISGHDPDTVVPSLVVKISRLDHVAWMAREAWFYDELERFQGSVVPYCFGWFETELPNESSVVPLDLCPPRGYDSDDEEDEDEDPDALKSYEGGEIHPLLAERHSRRNIVAVLILERLGGMLRLYRPVDQTFGAGKDIYSMHRELGEIGIVPWDDIRRENILQAMPLPAGISPRRSPLGRKKYHWRLIDLERFVKCNYSRYGCRTVWAGNVVQMFCNVSRGFARVYSDDEVELDDTDSDDK